MIDLKIIGRGATTTIYRDGNTAIKLYVNAPTHEAVNEVERQEGLEVP